jgi:proteic killer suppression protein
VQMRGVPPAAGAQLRRVATSVATFRRKKPNYNGRRAISCLGLGAPGGMQTHATNLRSRGIGRSGRGSSGRIASRAQFRLDTYHVTRYIRKVIRSFADRHTEWFWTTGSSGRLPPEIERRALRKLSALDAADQIETLRVPPGNRLHVLEGDRAGQHSISISDQWRICFVFRDGDAYDVEVCDYH